MKALEVWSFAKINLGLEVLGVRQDGFHELRTLFQTINLKDRVRLEPCREGVTVECDHPGVPTDRRNLAARAALDLQRFAGIRSGVNISIRKRIPVAGGLGGGSSNAAAVLMGLDRLWGLGLGADGLHLLARRIGADVPYFLVGGTALGVARGDEVYPLHRQIRASVVIASPDRPVSTAAVFRRVDASLTPKENGHTIFCFISRDLEGDDAFAVLRNDLEKAALEEAPELRESVGRIRGTLVREGARLAALSGSGSSYFGVFDDARAAKRAERALKGEGVSVFRGRTVPLGEYRKAWDRARVRRSLPRTAQRAKRTR